MFLILCLAFGFATASPTCTDEEGLKCIPGGEGDSHWLDDNWPNDEAKLDEVCKEILKELDCEADFGERCPETIFGLYLEGIKRHKGLYKKLCDKSNTLRAEYLKHVSCVNEKILNLGDQCQNHMDLFQPDFTCSSGYHGYKTCVKDIIRDGCGDDGAKIFDTLYAPRQPIYEVICQKLCNILKDLGLIKE
ncbi:uncharacterized protein LOC129225130 [Uloborus diversus]|uniref:uncharacterized protein LOC129225130 n=1 Tax=Uloborus diversus TaxID=327109 RepID=UPI0024095F65|nr:uncharacterized protein LOC129225130 [Uloborus diversus]